MAARAGLSEMIFSIRNWLDHPSVSLLAPVVLVSAFLVSGVLKAIDFPNAVGEVRALSGLEPANVLAAIVIAVQLAVALIERRAIEARP